MSDDITDMFKRHDDDVYLLLPMGGKPLSVHADKAEARRTAARLVGNDAPAEFDDGYFFGPGDGTTTVRVMRASRALVRAAHPNLDLAKL